MTVMPSCCVDVLERIHDDLRIERIKRGDRLVGEDQLRRLHQRTGDGDTLLLPARQRAGALHRGLGDVRAAPE
jgi:hypothetical protein